MSKCTRCGKDRIIKSTHTETKDNTAITYTETICPDPECQKMVEKGLLSEQKKRKTIHDEQVRRQEEQASKRKSIKLGK